MCIFNYIFIKVRMRGFFSNCISFIAWNYVGGTIQSCTDFKTYAMTGQETFTNSSFTLFNIHRCKGPLRWHQATINSAPFLSVQHSRAGFSVCFFTLSHKQDGTKFWPFLPQSFLPPTNRQETSVGQAWRGRRSKGASKKFGAVEEACVKWGWKWRQWED